MAPFEFPLPTQPFIHGKFVDTQSQERQTLFSAVDNSVVTTELQYANTNDVNIAVESAEEALVVWSSFPASKRRTVLLRFADLIVERAKQLGYLESIVVGKPISISSGREPETCAELFRYFAGYTDKLDGESYPVENGMLKLVLREPLGICGAINAFNSPMILMGMKAAPALAVGNVMVVKASEVNPLSSLLLAELAIEAGFPAGALNVLVGGPEAGVALSSHMKIRKISFTGSVATGKRVQIAATQSNLKRVTLELGGKSPVLVFPDADFDNAVDCASRFLAFNGQVCVCGSRIYVHASIADRFVEALKVKVETYGASLRSDPLDISTFSSPMYHAGQKKSVLDFLASGKRQAQLITGGEALGEKGLYIKPTIFFKPDPNARVLKEEIFGPVAVIDTFETEEEVLEKANDTEYGLGASIYTKDINRAIRLATAIQAGAVSINDSINMHPTMPFGGFKSSGIGRENGKYVLNEYTQTKSIFIKYA